MTPTIEPPCPKCKDRGHIIWVYLERRPRPAYWFTLGPNREWPTECDCRKEAAEASDEILQRLFKS